MTDVVLKPWEPAAGEHPLPLGWNQHHHEGNLAFPVVEVPTFDPTRPIAGRSWRYGRTPLDQGELGSCTGNAEEKRRCSMRKALGLRCYCTERAAVTLYELASELDGVPGAYPPDDTGSTTVGVLKASQQQGWISSYRWSFGDELECARVIDQLGAGIMGIDWYEAMDNPDPKTGELVIGGGIRGGHELVVDEVWPDSRYAGGYRLGGWQSWGLVGVWGTLKGRWTMAIATFAKLRAQGAEFGIGFP